MKMYSIGQQQYGIERVSQILRVATDAVARGLGLPAGRLAGNHTDAVPKHSLLFQFSFQVDGHTHRCTFAKRRLSIY